MIDFLAEEYDINVSEDTISRVLRKENISRKKVSRRWASILIDYF
jgi:hypothetical protein